MSLERLRDEIRFDPLGIGYAGMTDAQILTSLKAKTRSKERAIIPSYEVVSAIIPAEWSAVNTGERERINFIVGAGQVNVQSPNVRTAFTTAFPTGTTTRGNLVALISESISRLNELSIPETIFEGDVSYARKL
jgi:hypothetical protein